MKDAVKQSKNPSLFSLLHIFLAKKGKVMSAEDIYELLQPKIKRLNNTEKKKLYSRIFSEAHPAFRVRKRGKTRSLSEAKEKLKRDFRVAYVQENGRL